jgi:hypothetical protein
MSEDIKGDHLLGWRVLLINVDVCVADGGLVRGDGADPLQIWRLSVGCGAGSSCDQLQRTRRAGHGDCRQTQG